MKPVKKWVVLLLAMAVAGCSGTDNGEASETTTSAVEDVTTTAVSVETTAEAQTTTTQAVAEPVISGVAAVGQLTAEAGGGPRPLLEWSPVDGASSYYVVVYDNSGLPYWSMLTSDTQIYVGGAKQIPEGRDGPEIAAGYSWVVYADDSSGNLLAASGQRSISP